MADRVCRRCKKENHAISSDTCVDRYILLLEYLSNHMHPITNGYIRFLKANSTDPRHCVPLRVNTFKMGNIRIFAKLQHTKEIPLLITCVCKELMDI